MHATYFFLTEIDHFDDPRDLACAIQSEIVEYAFHWCDENNWWSIEGATLYSDHHLDFSEEPRLIESPGCWYNSWLTAYQAVAHDMMIWFPDRDYARWQALLNGPDDAGATVDDLRAWLRFEPPTMLATLYSSLAAADAQADHRLAGYRRGGISQALELYLASDDDGCAPFARQLAAPYDYRAFNLRGDDSANAIVHVDIHT